MIIISSFFPLSSVCLFFHNGPTPFFPFTCPATSTFALSIQPTIPNPGQLREEEDVKERLPYFARHSVENMVESTTTPEDSPVSGRTPRRLSSTRQARVWPLTPPWSPSPGPEPDTELASRPVSETALASLTSLPLEDGRTSPDIELMSISLRRPKALQ